MDFMPNDGVRVLVDDAGDAFLSPALQLHSGVDHYNSFRWHKRGSLDGVAQVLETGAVAARLAQFCLPKLAHIVPDDAVGPATVPPVPVLVFDGHVLAMLEQAHALMGFKLEGFGLRRGIPQLRIAQAVDRGIVALDDSPRAHVAVIDAGQQLAVLVQADGQFLAVLQPDAFRLETSDGHALLDHVELGLGNRGVKAIAYRQLEGLIVEHYRVRQLLEPALDVALGANIATTSALEHAALAAPSRAEDAAHDVGNFADQQAAPVRGTRVAVGLVGFLEQHVHGLAAVGLERSCQFAGRYSRAHGDSPCLVGLSALRFECGQYLGGGAVSSGGWAKHEKCPSPNAGIEIR
ncbi:hypothetical protein PSOLE_46960 [Pseudomonas oleovorans subsp. oleovorans]|nr:hypothetical protein PSOLE_46960 [Pseudomonas oleovorans subsp. oleovorans]